MDHAAVPAALLLLLLIAPTVAFGARLANDRDPSTDTSEDMSTENRPENAKPTRWALLLAGSSGYGNYRHQADVCHAYQLLRRGGLKEENIVVMMYDDIAYDPLNPRPGVIINHPKGEDVYAGVPKDYTGPQVNVKNFYAVLLGNKSAVEGGSGKVIDSKPNDRIFIYYTDHGGPGVLLMPNESLYADDLIKVLKRKHALKSYKEMVIYVEACESGSIFEGLLPKNLNIYATTAANAVESSWATYCPGSADPPPPEYQTCLGDLYSVAWLEDSESHNLKKETIGKQYHTVKLRTSNLNDSKQGSHVMDFGDKRMKSQKLYHFQGFDPANANATEIGLHWRLQNGIVDQRDADLLFLWTRYERLADNSEEKKELLKEITDTISHRMHLDSSVEFIGRQIFGPELGPSILTEVRPQGQALVDDWDCLKAMVRIFESHCGSLTQYGMKYTRAFANLCNYGVSRETMQEASAIACDPNPIH